MRWYYKLRRLGRRLKDRRTLSPFFDERWYRARYADLKDPAISAIDHYLEYGWKEGRWPTEQFNSRFYLDTYQDVRESGINPFVHYVQYGQREGRLPNEQPRRVEPKLFLDERGPAASIPASRQLDMSHSRRLTRYVRRFVSLSRSAGLQAALLVTWSFLKRRYAKSDFSLPVVRLIDGQRSPGFERHSGIGVIRERGVLISILMPVFNTPAEVLGAAIESVRNQTWQNWELCICDDCSTSQETSAVLDRYRGVDWRIKIVRSEENLHIARATNLAAELAAGEFVAFLDHDDVLEPDALELIAESIAAEADIDFVYTDEDKLEKDGILSEPYLKPDWSPEHLQSVMYIMHFSVIRKSLFFELGGLRHEFTGAQDYDLALRATQRARKIVHIPKVLYHWRKIPGSAAEVVDAKPAALVNAKRALIDFATSIDPGASVVDGLLTGTYRVKFPVDPSVPVTLLILTDARRKIVEGRGDVFLLENFFDSIQKKSTFRNYRLLIVDNGNIPPQLRARIQNAGGKILSYHYDGAFNFSSKMNFALKYVETEDVIFLNDDLEVITPDWIESILQYSRQPQIGAVGGRLLFANGRIQHAGVVLGVNYSVAHLFHNLPSEAVGYYGFSHIVRNYSAVTGAVLATRMSIVRQVGPFDENMRIDFNDIDFCLRIRTANYRIVYTPYCEMYHFEGGSEARTTQSQSDKDAFMARWDQTLQKDPFYNPILPRDRVDCYVENWLQPAVTNYEASGSLAQQPERKKWRPPSRQSLGVNFIGPVEVVSGLGVSARGYVDALEAAKIPLNVIPWRIGFEHQKFIKRTFPKTVHQQINIIHLNADMLEWAMPNLRKWMRTDSYNIGIWYWELSVFRPEWLPYLDMLDEVWTSSSFQTRAIGANSSKPVRLVRPALSAGQRSDCVAREKFGLTRGNYVFFYAFDFGSVLERKNPFALIEAFTQEFTPVERAVLLLKVNYPDRATEALTKIKQIAAEAGNIVLLDKTLGQNEMQELWGCCDCYVSPHRSEGLGLTLIEAMFAEKPVIATPYGGVSDFILPETSLPIDFDLREIQMDRGPYPQGYMWADPKAESLRSLMRAVFENRQVGKRIGQAGRAHIEQLFSVEEAGRAVRRELMRIHTA
jgi:glycosyltransferase involved in cell wall biosynthesis